MLELLKDCSPAEKQKILSNVVGANYLNFINYFSNEPEPARHHRYIIEKLEEVANGELKRLMLFLPPGSAKSTYSSINFPPYWMAKNPGKLIIGASHSGELAERFGRKVRNIVASDQYRDTFDVTLADDSKAAGRWETSTQGEYYAVGVRGSVTGRRGDLGLIDDPVKGRKEAESAQIQADTFEWYKSDFRTRLKPNAAIILIQTRWVEDDLAGQILPEDYDGRSGPVIARDGELWEVVNLPMVAREEDALGRKPGDLLWPQWFNYEWVEQEKRAQGPRNWNALYQQDPAPDEGDYFRRTDFRWYDKKPKHLKLYMAGDYAVSEGEGDYTEIGIFGLDPNDDIYIVDWFRGQVGSLDIVETLLDFNEAYNPVKSIGETGVIRRALEPILRRRMRERKAFMPLEWLVHSHGDKPAMARSFQALVQQNRVHLPKKEWADTLINQLTKFPAGRWDDGVDACSLFGRFIDQTWKAQKPKKPEKAVKVSGMREIKIADFHEEPLYD